MHHVSASGHEGAHVTSVNLDYGFLRVLDQRSSPIRIVYAYVVIAAYVVQHPDRKDCSSWRSRTSKYCNTISLPFQTRPHSARSVKTPNLCLYLLGCHLDICKGKESQSAANTKKHLFETYIWMDLQRFTVLADGIDEKKKACKLTLTELLLPHPLREPLQARHNELNNLVLEHLALLPIIIQHPRKLMSLLRLLQKIKKPRELLLGRGLSPAAGLVLVVRERLQERGKVGVKVARFGGAEVRVDRVLGRPRENFRQWGPRL